MKLKSVIISVFACALGLCLSGCEKNSCMLNVISSYSGWGIDGQDLGSGSFYETFAVSPGDVFYEDYDGHWIRNGKNNYEEIITVKEINDDGVIIEIGENEITMIYDFSKHIESRYVVCDGINYEYSILFIRDKA